MSPIEAQIEDLRVVDAASSWVCLVTIGSPLLLYELTCHDGSCNLSTDKLSSHNEVMAQKSLVVLACSSGARQVQTLSAILKQETGSPHL